MCVGSVNGGTPVPVPAPSAAATKRGEIERLLDEALADLGPSTIASADVFGAMTSTDPEFAEWPFNDHAPGSDEWYQHGLEYGVWVTGAQIAAADPVRGPLEADTYNERYRGVMEMTARQLQRLNDAFARLHAEGASRRQMQALMRQTIPPVNDDALALDMGLGKTGLDDFSRLYHTVRLETAEGLQSAIIDRRDWGRGHYLPEMWAQYAFIAMDEAIRELDIELEDGRQRRSKGFDKAMGRRRDVAAAIAHLPAEEQAAVWDEFYGRLRGELDRLEGDLDIERIRRPRLRGQRQAMGMQGPAPATDPVWPEDDGRVEAADPLTPFSAALAETRLRSALTHLEHELRSGTSRRGHAAGLNIIRNLLA